MNEEITENNDVRNVPMYALRSAGLKDSPIWNEDTHSFWVYVPGHYRQWIFTALDDENEVTALVMSDKYYFSLFGRITQSDYSTEVSWEVFRIKRDTEESTEVINTSYLFDVIFEHGNEYAGQLSMVLDKTLTGTAAAKKAGIKFNCLRPYLKDK